MFHEYLPTPFVYFDLPLDFPSSTFEAKVKSADTREQGTYSGHFIYTDTLTSTTVRLNRRRGRMNTTGPPSTLGGSIPTSGYIPAG